MMKSPLDPYLIVLAGAKNTSDAEKSRRDHKSATLGTGQLFVGAFKATVLVDHETRFATIRWGEACNHEKDYSSSGRVGLGFGGTRLGR
jgi:hypothetical protein